jgi:tetratricopeptide (TPR) repeat protein
MALSRRTQEIYGTIAILSVLLGVAWLVVRREHQHEAERAQRAAVLEIIRHYKYGPPPANVQQWAERSIAAEKEKFDRAPQDFFVAKNIAYLYGRLNMWDDAKQWYRKASPTAPNDMFKSDAYYRIGEIDEKLVRDPLLDVESKLGQNMQQDLNDLEICQEFKAKHDADATEGIEALRNAIQLRPDYGEARSELNLLWREKSLFECDPAVRATDLKNAEAAFQHRLSSAN